MALKREIETLEIFMALWMVWPGLVGLVLGLLAGLYLSLKLLPAYSRLAFLFGIGGALIGAAISIGYTGATREVNASFYTPAAVAEVCKLIKKDALTGYGLAQCPP